MNTEYIETIVEAVSCGELEVYEGTNNILSYVTEATGPSEIKSVMKEYKTSIKEAKVLMKKKDFVNAKKKIQHGKSKLQEAKKLVDKIDMSTSEATLRLFASVFSIALGMILIDNIGTSAFNHGIKEIDTDKMREDYAKDFNRKHKIYKHFGATGLDMNLKTYLPGKHAADFVDLSRNRGKLKNRALRAGGAIGGAVIGTATSAAVANKNDKDTLKRAAINSLKKKFHMMISLEIKACNKLLAKLDKSGKDYSSLIK